MDLKHLNSLSDRHLIVAGEVGIDEYLWGSTYRISPEAPVPIVEVERQEQKLGLAANVAQNIVSLGAQVTLISVSGGDVSGTHLGQMISLAGIKNSVMIQDDSRPTLRKARVISAKQHVVRIDYERTHPLSPEKIKDFREAICDHLPKSDGIIIQDYGKGLWQKDVMSFIKLAKELKKPVFVDPSRLSSPELYLGATLMTPNSQEAQQLLGIPLSSKELTGNDDLRLKEMAMQLLEKTQTQHIIITCGPYGMISVSRDNHDFKRIPTFAKEVFDVTGAGDTVIAVMGLSYTSGFKLTDCMTISNAAAGIVVGQMGTAVVTPAQLHSALEQARIQYSSSLEL